MKLTYWLLLFAAAIALAVWALCHNGWVLSGLVLLLVCIVIAVVYLVLATITQPANLHDLFGGQRPLYLEGMRREKISV